MTVAPPWTRVGRWRVWCAPESGAPPETWLATVERLTAAGASLHRSKHADTYRWARSGGDVYVKVYRRYRRWTALKDWFRPSKAANVYRMSDALTARGFLVPQVLALAEERRILGGGRSWIATAALAGEPIATRIAALAAPPNAALATPPNATLAAPPNATLAAPLNAALITPSSTALAAAADPTALRAKRGLLTSLGREVANLHRSGVVAGDLVPANVWIALAAADLRIAFLDHDRTRIGPPPAAWPRARRNLVQLNRVVLRGVTSADRLRVYHAYAAASGWTRSDARERLPWIVAKTLARRRAERSVTPIAADADLRMVMRAGGPYDRGRASGARP